MTNKEASNKQEHLIAKYLGWNVVSGSGARACHPGDIQSSQWLGECKTHTEPGHSLLFSTSVWSKLQDEAASRFKYPVLFVDDGSQKLENTWCLLSSKSVDWDAVMDVDWQIYDKSFKKNITISIKDLSRRCKEIHKSPIHVGFHIFHAGYSFLLVSVSLFRQMCIEMGWAD